MSRTVTRLIVEPTQDGRDIRGVWDVTSLMPERLQRLRECHEPEFVYACDYDALLTERDALQAKLARVETAARKVLEGFERGIFVRDTSQDVSSEWAIKLLPYVQALAALAPATEKET